MFVRWSNLSIEAEERARLPGYRDDAVVRHFEAPDAVPTRFYEVRAKSILNRVPEASQMPFRWTINPFRGCTHSCVYCVSGDTPILMADGRHKPLYETDVGDAIYGTQVGESGYRRYVRTTVLDKWITIKPAYRLTLEGGTELIVSGDHRFLSNRGWKHVLNSERGQPDRPHLTTRNRLIGTGPFAPQPAHTPDYRRGYLCGIVRGDGTLGSYNLRRSRGGSYTGYRFRLALTDLEALRRARGFLHDAAVETGERVFQKAAGGHREMVAIAAESRGSFDRITELVEWPLVPSADWSRGFLAGIFDAEGCRSAHVLRISNKDPEILGWIKACASRLGFDTCLENAGSNGAKTVRIRGGVSEHLRFFHLTDPAITRKRDIDGHMVRTFANLRVAEIEPLGRRLPLYDITTGTGDFIANGVVSRNCFAPPTHTYLDFNAGRDFEREIVVKVNAPERLRAELAKPSWKGEHIAMGTNTDPYQALHDADARLRAGHDPRHAGARGRRGAAAEPDGVDVESVWPPGVQPEPGPGDPRSGGLNPLSECGASVLLEEVDGDDVVVRVQAAPESPDDGAQLADEIMVALSSVTGEHEADQHHPALDAQEQLIALARG